MVAEGRRVRGGLRRRRQPRTGHPHQQPEPADLGVLAHRPAHPHRLGGHRHLPLGLPRGGPADDRHHGRRLHRAVDRQNRCCGGEPGPGGHPPQHRHQHRTHTQPQRGRRTAGHRRHRGGRVQLPHRHHVVHRNPQFRPEDRRQVAQHTARLGHHPGHHPPGRGQPGHRPDRQRQLLRRGPDPAERGADRQHQHLPAGHRPPLSPGEPGWAWISSQTPNTSYWQGTNNTHDTYGHVGYDDWCSDGSSGCTGFQKTRSLFSLDMTGLLTKHVTAATLSVTEQGPTSSHSGTRQIDLHGGGAFNSSTTWNNASISSSVAASANFASVTTNTTGNANFTVTTLVQNAVSAGSHTQTMALEASDESDDTAYRYLHGTVALAVTYWSVPNVPTNLSTSAAASGASKACDTTAPGMWINKNDSNSVTLHASLTGPDTGYPENADYWYRQFAPTTDPSWTEAPQQTVTAQTTAQPTQVTLPAIPDGSQYEWSVYAKVDNDAYSSTAAPATNISCWFRTDFTAPTVTVTSPAPPTSTGTTGTLALAASDAGTNPSGVKEIDYNIDGTSLNSGGAGETAATGSTAAITLPATSWGTHTIWYDTVDNAGNQSAPAHFDYYVPEGAFTPGTAGDLDGDGKPDLTTVATNGDLHYYSNPFANSPTTGGPLIPASHAPNSTSFAGALITHRGSLTGQTCDDLVIIQSGSLQVATDNNNCSPGTGWTLGLPQARPTSTTGDTTNYNTTDWSSVQQAVMLPATAATNNKPALVTLENDNGVPTVWMYTATGSTFRTATLLATGSYWSHVTLLSPGLINGSPALWVRDTSTGALLQYPNIETWQGNTTAPTGGATIAASGYRISQYPAITTDGPADNTGPTLWATNRTGQLIDIPTTVDTSGNTTTGTPITVGAAGWAANNQTLDGVRPLHPTTSIGVFRASSEQFVFATANNNATVDHTAVFGQSGDIPLTGDWNGDGIDTIGIYRPSTRQFILSNSSTNPAQDITVAFGNSGDIPIVGDWNGDGIDTIGVFRPSTRHFYLSDSNTSPAVDHAVWFGTTGDQPIIGDWNGDGTTTVGIYRPSTKQFVAANSLSNPTVDATIAYGDSGDTPLTGDWNGDGTTTIGIWRPSAFSLDNSLTSSTTVQTTSMGISTDTPITGDWNGQ
ncbi:DNRLRE domain-containing protein [Streptacidiphilus sp. PAMC 29251]